MTYGDTEQERLIRCCCCSQPIEDDEPAERTAEGLKHRRCQGEQSYLSDHTSGAAGAVRGP